ncbi:MAG: AsmA family protein [Candidatus Omnitrophica bacterium]|nr:AsmA family protein [Candidatus Omnitrophota bacterium]
MKKKIIAAVLLLLSLLILVGLLYLNNILLPTKIKGMLIQSLESTLNYNVSIEKISYSLFRGLVIQNASVYDKIFDDEHRIFSVKEISSHILFLPLLKDRKVVLPVVLIDSPRVNLRYQGDGSTNFSKALEAFNRKEPEKKNSLSFFAYKVKISSGLISFKDGRLSPAFSRDIQDIDLGMNLDLPDKIDFLAKARIKNDNSSFTIISLDGKYNITSSSLDSKANLLNIVVIEFNPYLKKLPVVFEAGSIEKADLNIKLKDKVLGISGNIQAKNLKVNKDAFSLQANMAVDPNIDYNLENNALDYKIGFKLLQANLSGLPYIEKIGNICGLINLTPDKLSADNLTLEAQESAFGLKATLENFTRPYVEADFTCDKLTLEKISALLPGLPEGTQLSGNAKLGLTLKGHLLKPALNTQAILELDAAALKIAALKEPLSGIKGKINYTFDNLELEGISFDYLDIPYTLNAKAIGLPDARINLELNSLEVDLKSDLKVKGKNMRINSFKAKYMDSLFDVRGDLDITQMTNPVLDLVLKSSFKAEDLAKIDFLPGSENITRAKLRGPFEISGTLAGKAKDYKSWDISAKCSSDSVSLYNFSLNKLSFNLTQKNGTLNISRFNAYPYDGTLNLELNTDLKTAPAQNYLKASLSKINLAKLKQDTGLRDKDISGTLNADFELSGDFKNPVSLMGTGAFAITEGNLWKLDLLKGLGELVLLPDYEKVSMKGASADFSVANKSFSTENLNLAGEQLKIEARGSLGFDGALDFLANLRVNKNLIKESSDIRKFTTAIIGELSQAFSVKITGTLQKPEYKIIPVAAELIKSIKDFFLGK